MNREGHLFYSQLILIFSMSGLLLYLLEDYGLKSVSIAIFSSIVTYLFGCLAPDLDHHAVHRKIFFLKWLGKVSHHRGHWHSLFSMIIYGGILFLIFFWLIFYWWAPVFAGMFGFFTHLLLDEIKNLKTGGSRAIKIF
jgi:hypothetical protein